MRVRTVLALAAILAGTAGAAAPAPTGGTGVTISLELRGVSIQTPADGQFLLDYPSLTDATQKATTPTDVSVAKNTASMRYANGAQLTATLKNGSMMLHFTVLPDAAKGMRMEMTLPPAFQDGGQWQMDEPKPQPFPTQFAGEQFDEGDEGVNEGVSPEWRLVKA